jgi:hypothetical protein
LRRGRPEGTAAQGLRNAGAGARLIAAISIHSAIDLIFGTAKQNLKITETPIGETQILRFRDGWLLLKMVWFAYRKLKAI